mmetsp:Transcript_20245/g.33766  ORF Transcript_20245/g.33766 Transcript_20245/m.33766 type:complete len:87 (-) Transcript_20245:323-583(-)
MKRIDHSQDRHPLNFQKASRAKESVLYETFSSSCSLHFLLASLFFFRHLGIILFFSSLTHPAASSFLPFNFVLLVPTCAIIFALRV